MEFNTIKFAKWIEELRRVPNTGEKRVRSAFLLFPKIIGNKGKWLVNAKWEEEYCMWTHTTDGYRIYGWTANRWL